MNKPRCGSLIAFCCLAFISLEAAAFCIGYAYAGNICTVHECNYTQGRNTCWVTIDDVKDSGCFLEQEFCPNSTVCYLKSDLGYDCVDTNCDKSQLEFLSLGSGIIFILMFLCFAAFSTRILINEVGHRDYETIN